MKITIEMTLEDLPNLPLARQVQYALSGLLHEAHAYELPREVNFHLPPADYGRIPAADISVSISTEK